MEKIKQLLKKLNSSRIVYDEKNDKLKIEVIRGNKIYDVYFDEEDLDDIDNSASKIEELLEAAA